MRRRKVTWLSLLQSQQNIWKVLGAATYKSCIVSYFLSVSIKNIIAWGPNQQKCSSSQVSRSGCKDPKLLHVWSLICVEKVDLRESSPHARTPVVYASCLNTTGNIGLGLTHMTSFNLINNYKDIIPKYRRIPRSWRLTSTYRFGGNKFQFMTQQSSQ